MWIRITMIILMPIGLTGCGVCMKFGIKSVTAIRFVFIILSYYNLSYNNFSDAAALRSHVRSWLARQTGGGCGVRDDAALTSWSCRLRRRGSARLVHDVRPVQRGSLLRLLGADRGLRVWEAGGLWRGLRHPLRGVAA